MGAQDIKYNGTCLHTAQTRLLPLRARLLLSEGPWVTWKEAGIHGGALTLRLLQARPPLLLSERTQVRIVTSRPSSYAHPNLGVGTSSLPFTRTVTKPSDTNCSAGKRHGCALFQMSLSLQIRGAPWLRPPALPLQPFQKTAI